MSTKGAEGTINCTICGEGVALTFHRLEGTNAPEWSAALVVDMQPMHVHMQQCEGAKALSERPPVAPPVAKPTVVQSTVPKAALTSRINRWLDARSYVDMGGSRACTMCGVKGAECLEGLATTKQACCAACANGGTHPNPGGTKGCAEWAADRAEKADK